MRWKNVLLTQFSFQLSRRAPELVKKGIRKGVAEALPEGYDVDTDFTPVTTRGTSACASYPTATSSGRSAPDGPRW